MAWSLVASTPASANSGTSPFNLTLGAACVIDDRVVVEAAAFANGSNDAVTGITATFCGTFTKDAETGQITNGSFNTKGSIWSAPVTSNGTPVLSISWTGSSGGGAASAAAYRGLNTSVGSAAVDVSNTATGSSSAPSVTTGATSAANELVVGGFTCDENTITFTEAGGSTRRTFQVNAHGDTAIQDKDSGATGAQTSNGTTNVSSIWGMVAVVYKLAAGAAATQSASYIPADVPNKNVGPRVLRFLWRQPTPTWVDLAPVTNTEFGPVPARLPNRRVGPPVLRLNFRQPQVWDVIIATGGDVTIALTGITTTLSPGTLTPSTTVPLTGITATASPGTLTPSTSVPLTGIAATGGVGTVTPSTTVPLTGSSSTASPGTVVPSTSVPITGSASTVSAGTLAPTTTVAITGGASTLSVGSLTPSTTVVITGTSITASAGTVTSSGGTPAASVTPFTFTPADFPANPGFDPAAQASGGTFTAQTQTGNPSFTEDPQGDPPDFVPEVPPNRGNFN